MPLSNPRIMMLKNIVIFKECYEHKDCYLPITFTKGIESIRCPLYNNGCKGWISPDALMASRVPDFVKKAIQVLAQELSEEEMFELLL